MDRAAALSASIIVRHGRRVCQPSQILVRVRLHMEHSWLLPFRHYHLLWCLFGLLLFHLIVNTRRVKHFDLQLVNDTG